MKDLINHFFPPKSLQRQNRYLHRGLYKPCDNKIRNFICGINNIVEYLEISLRLGLIIAYLNMRYPISWSSCYLWNGKK